MVAQLTKRRVPMDLFALANMTAAGIGTAKDQSRRATIGTVARYLCARAVSCGQATVFLEAKRGGVSGVTFTFYGAIVSSNRVARRVGRRTIANPEAVADKQTVFQLAYAAARECDWQKPPACAVGIVAYNSRLDADNLSKCLLDGMQGAVYDDDNTVVQLTVTKLRDHGGVRYVVQVQPRELPQKPKKPRLARKTSF